MSRQWISIAAAILGLTSGCQCCPWFDSYANVVDDASDRHIYFDHWYNPKFDLTRMGKPDWSTPFTNYFCPRCNNGSYDRYDDCNLYPPITPYEYPNNIMPPPTVRTKRVPPQIDLDLMPDPNTPAPVPPAAPKSDTVEPKPAPAPDVDQ